MQAGAKYVLVDDFVGMDGTLANLKGYIEFKGGKVVAAVCLTRRAPLRQTGTVARAFA